MAIAAITVIIYLNRTYALMYDSVSEKHFSSPFTRQEYMVTQTSGEQSIYEPFPKISDSPLPFKYAALGDSLMAGVGSADYQKTLPFYIAEKLAYVGNPITLVNLAQSGATSKTVLEQQVPQALKENPDYVTLLIGINDVRGWYSQDKFTSNFQQIINDLSRNPKTEIIVFNIPYLQTDQTLRPPWRQIIDRRTKEFNKVISKICADKENVSVIDLYGQTIHWRSFSGLYSLDLFHPSDTGYMIWADLLHANYINFYWPPLPDKQCPDRHLIWQKNGYRVAPDPGNLCSEGLWIWSDYYAR